MPRQISYFFSAADSIKNENIHHTFTLYHLDAIAFDLIKVYDVHKIGLKLYAPIWCITITFADSHYEHTDPHLKQIENFCAPDLDTNIEAFFLWFVWFSGPNLHPCVSLILRSEWIPMTCNSFENFSNTAPIHRCCCMLLHIDVCMCVFFMLLMSMYCSTYFQWGFSAPNRPADKKLCLVRNNQKTHSKNNKIASLLNLNGYLPTSLLRFFLRFCTRSHGIWMLKCGALSKMRWTKKTTIMQT